MRECLVMLDHDGQRCLPKAEQCMLSSMQQVQLCGNQQPASLPLPPSFVQVPAARAVVLEEPLLELSQIGFDELTYIISFGHSPGHISLLHSPSSTVLAGDALSFVKPSLRLNSPADANDTRVSRAGNWQQDRWRWAWASCDGDLLCDAPLWPAMQVVGTWRVSPSLPGLTLRAWPHVLCVGSRYSSRHFRCWAV